MFDRIKKLFGGKEAAPPANPDPDGKLASAWYDQKSALMVEMLGAEHDHVMHAIFPYAVGGGLDLYYFPHGIPGTAIATKELSELPNQGSPSGDFSCYELVMFTRQAVNLDGAKDLATPFGQAHRSINSILNCVARYSATTELNPCATVEFPADMEPIGGKCLICATYGARSAENVARFGLLMLMEIHRSEMDFARTHSGAALIEKLKFAGHYPYSDLDRPPVA